jgi:hypothetical protein
MVVFDFYLNARINSGGQIELFFVAI